MESRLGILSMHPARKKGFLEEEDSGGRWLDAGNEAAPDLGESVEGEMEPRGFLFSLNQRGELRVGLHVFVPLRGGKWAKAVPEKLGVRGLDGDE